MEQNKWRMYCLVLKQLSSIDKGIQCAHACTEYTNLYQDTDEFQEFIKESKTLIMLNGGNYNDMMGIKKILEGRNINYSIFYEEDLNNLITSICFLAEDKIWDKNNYLKYEDFYIIASSISTQITLSKSNLSNIENLPLYNKIYCLFKKYNLDMNKIENAYIDYIGGENNYIIENIISNKKLAQ